MHRGFARRGRAGMALATAGGLVAGLGLSQAAQAAPTTSAALAGSRPAFAAHAKDLGAVNRDTAVDFDVVLALPNQAAVAQEVAAVSTPGSPSFRHFLTPAQFQARYSPSTSSVAAVESWLRGAGLHVKSVASSRMYVEVTGTAAQAEHLVGTSLHTYQYRGKNLTAPSADYRVPADLAGTVAGVVGLDNSSQLQPAATLPGPPPGAYYGVQPCSAYYGQKVATAQPPAYGRHWPYTICGYNADQYEQAYGLYHSIQHGNNGHGVTVAITDAYAAPTILSDANRWSRGNNLAPFAPGQFAQSTPAPNGYNQENLCGPQGWYGEETLDVESVHAMAPGANVLYVGASNCSNGLDNAWASVIDRHLASVETDSWLDGTENLPQGTINFYHQYLMEAAATGVTVMFSSGDSGPYGNNGKEVSLPASDPYATGVGGTSTEIGRSGRIVFQAGWSSFYSSLQNGQWTPAPPGNFSSGAGGGTSVLYRQPSYQRGVVPPNISEYYGSTPMRAVPDVAMPADPNTGLRIGETQVFPNGTHYATYRLGGTSLASPLFAGVVADAIQHNRQEIGFINPLLYRRIGTGAISDVTAPATPQATVRTNLTDVTNPASPRSFVLQTIDVPTSIYAGPGYDDQTGVGTPNGVAFLNAMK